MQTYIIETIEKEYYCGITNNINKRLIDHVNENKPQWFGFKNRKRFNLKHIIKGNFEKQIKRAGVKVISNILDNASAP